MAEDWDGLAQFVRSSDMADKYKVLDIIDNVDVFKGREEKLKALSGAGPGGICSTNISPSCAALPAVSDI